MVYAAETPGCIAISLKVRFLWIAPLWLAVLAIISVISVGFLLTTAGEVQEDSRILVWVLVALGGLILVPVRAREVTERQLFAQGEQLAEPNSEQARLNAEENEFMTIAAHDLRSPLNRP